MTIAVVDAAVVVDLVCGFPAAEPYRSALARADAIAAPAHLDSEVLFALGRLKRAGRLTRPEERVQALSTFRATRWPLRPLLLPAWGLGDRISIRDALYVALAISLQGVLITTDARLRRGVAGIVAVVEPD